MKLRYGITISVLLLLGAAAIPLARQVFASDAGALTFVIDAGHGGEDGGAVSGDGLRESDVNLGVAESVDALLALCGFHTVMTRTSDTIPYPDSATTTRLRKRFDQQQRVSLVASTENAVLVSIHQNKYATAAPSGAQVFYGKVAGSDGFAQCAQEMLGTLFTKQRQIAPISQDIYLMREVDCPAILIECGFLSNPAEAALLGTEAYQRKLGVCIAAACVRYSKELEKGYGKG